MVGRGQGSSPGHQGAGQLEALRSLPYFDPVARDVFDRVTRLTSLALDAPVALINLVRDGELLFASCIGPGDPWAETPGVPLGHAACQFAILSKEPLAIPDVREDARIADSPAMGELGVVGYLGVPLTLKDGETVGTLCAIAHAPRAWTDQDVELLTDLARIVTDHLDAQPAAMPAPGGINIAAVAQRTGVGADTLRKWERRYGVLRPNRTAGGQRRYDERDVARVEWLRDRLAEGFRIGEAAALLETSEVDVAATPEALRNAIVQAIGDTRLTHVPALVDQAFMLHDVETTVEEIIAPALREVGDRWRDGASRIADEHLLTALAQRRLVSLLDDRRHAVRGTAVLACAPGERHEFGLLALAVLLQADGWLAAYLGADTPLDSALTTVERAGANLLCLSVATEERYAELTDALAATDVPDDVTIEIGGAGAPPHPRLGQIVAGLRTTPVTRPA